MAELDEVKRLKAFKRKSCWNYERIAHEIGVHSQAVQAWFSGKYRPNNLSRKAINEFLKRQASGG